MSLVEAFIVYFSIGASFGAHRFFVHSQSKRSRIFAAIVAVFFWPLISVQKFISYINSVRSKLLFDVRAKTDSSFDTFVFKKQIEIECLLRNSFSGASLYSSKDVLARYTGLNLTISNFDGMFKHEIPFFAGSEINDLQNVCLSRRNRSKLLRHRSAVRQEFMSVLLELMASSDEPGRVAEIASGFVNTIGDSEAADQIIASLNTLTQNHPLSAVQKLENTSWAPQEH